MVRVKTFPTTDIMQNTSKVFKIDDKEIAIVHCDNAYYAIDDLCSHAEASLSDGEVYDCKVECPLHGAEFDLATGEAVTLPATKPVNTYPVSIEDGYLFLEIDNNA
tara:strand:+ start:131 stop:448 length:318 start_codon:yes stop_codon:yes gene_type:complete